MIIFGCVRKNRHRFLRATPQCSAFSCLPVGQKVSNRASQLITTTTAAVARTETKKSQVDRAQFALDTSLVFSSNYPKLGRVVAATALAALHYPAFYSHIFFYKTTSGCTFQLALEHQSSK